MTKIQTIVGAVTGIDLNGAIEDAIQRAEAPDDGYDFQTSTIDSIEIFRGGYMGVIETRVTVSVRDGDSKMVNEGGHNKT